MCWVLNHHAYGDSMKGSDTYENTEVQSLSDLYDVYQIVQNVCDGISDEISMVSGISKVNTAITAVGTVTSGGALAAGIVKSNTDKKIEDLQQRICNLGGCDPEKVSAMSDADFLNIVVQPLANQMEIERLEQEKNEAIAKSKKLGNWRSGLLGGSVVTNVAAAIIAGLNKNQSDLVQHITACNMAVDSLRNARAMAISNGISPIENPILNEFNDIIQICGTLDVKDVEKIEKRMGVVMGTSIGGAVVSAIGTGTSIAANTDSVRNDDTDAGKQREKNLNTAANVSAGVATVTGAVGTGFNISLITLTKKMLINAEQCERTL